MHGCHIHRIESPELLESFPRDGDGLSTARGGVVLVVAAADCVPILLFDSERRAAAALHAGWRGTLAGIAREGVRSLRDTFRGAATLDAVLGPGIGGCCYRVGPEVITAFEREGHPLEAIAHRTGDGLHLDLIAANRRILEEAGVDPERIRSTGLCTHCRGDLFPSYRRERSRAGRLLGFIGSAPP